jgi:hypothetical protein
LVTAVLFVAAPLALAASTAGPAAAITASTEAQLRAAYANVAETQIDLANDIPLENCTATGGDLDRSSSTPLTLDGHGFAITQTCPGERVIEQADPDGTLTLVAVTITGGDGTGTQATGGGVFTSGPLVIEDSLVTGNSAGPGVAGGSGLAGGLFGISVTITNSTISDNTAVRGAPFGALAGAMASNGPIEISDSTVSGNHAQGGSGIFGSTAGAIFTNDDVTITRSTFSGNVAEAGVDGNGGNGGAIATNGAVTLVNSTFTGNESLGTNSSTGGVGAPDVTLVYSTVAGNSAANSANVASGNLVTFGTVVALPLGGGDNCGPGTPATSNGWNFSDDTSCGFTNVAQGDRENAGDPLLGALADNGGPTLTMLPQLDSPLVDAIPIVNCQSDGASGIANDQRGEPRPGFDACDIGAVELQPVPPPEPPVPTPLVLEPTFTG